MSLSRPPLPLRIVRDHWGTPVVPFYKPGGVPLYSKHQLEAVRRTATETSVALNKKGSIVPTDALEAALGPAGYSVVADLEDSVQNRLADSMPEAAPLPFVAFPVIVQPAVPLPAAGAAALRPTAGSSASGAAASAALSPHGLAAGDGSSDSMVNNNSSTNSADAPGVSAFKQAAAPFETRGRYRFLVGHGGMASTTAADAATSSSSESSGLSAAPKTIAVDHAVPNVPPWFAAGNGHFQRGISLGVTSSALRGFYSAAARHKAIVSTYHVLCQVVPNTEGVSATLKDGADSTTGASFRVLGPAKPEKGGRGAGSATSGSSRLAGLFGAVPRRAGAGPSTAGGGTIDGAVGVSSGRTPPSAFLPLSPLLEGDSFFEGNRLAAAGHVRMATVPLSFVVGDSAVGEAMRAVCAKEARMASLFVRREAEGGAVLKRVPLVSMAGIVPAASSPQQGGGGGDGTSTLLSQQSSHALPHWTLRRPHPFLLAEQMVALQPIANPLLTGATTGATSNVRLVARTRAAVARQLRSYARGGSFSFKLLHYNPRTALALLQVTTSSLDEHQIRVALASAGLPMVGDFVYRDDVAKGIAEAHRRLHSPAMASLMGAGGATTDHRSLAFASVAAVVSGSGGIGASSAAAGGVGGVGGIANPFAVSPLTTVVQPLTQLPALWRRLIGCIREESTAANNSSGSRGNALTAVGATVKSLSHEAVPDTFLIVEAIVDELLGSSPEGQRNSGAAGEDAKKNRTSSSLSSASLDMGGGSALVASSSPTTVVDLPSTRGIVRGVLGGTSAATAKALGRISAQQRRRGAEGGADDDVFGDDGSFGVDGTGGGALTPAEEQLLWTKQHSTALRRALLALLAAAECDADTSTSSQSQSSSTSSSSPLAARLLPLLASLTLGPCVALSTVRYPAADSVHNAIIIEDVDVGDQLMRLSQRGGNSSSASSLTSETLGDVYVGARGGNGEGASGDASPILHRLAMLEAKVDVPMTFQVALKQQPVSLMLRHPMSQLPSPPSALFAALSPAADAFVPLATASATNGGNSSEKNLGVDSTAVRDAVKEVLYTIASMVEAGMGAEEVAELSCPRCMVAGHTLRTCPRRFDIGSLRTLALGSGSDGHRRGSLLALPSGGADGEGSSVDGGAVAAVETEYFADKALVAKHSILGTAMTEGLRARGGVSSAVAGGNNSGGIADAVAGIGGGGGASALRFVENKTPRAIASRERAKAAVPSFHRSGGGGGGGGGNSSTGRIICQYCHGLHSVTECPKLGLSSTEALHGGAMTGANGQPMQKVSPTSHKECFDTSCFEDAEAGELSALFCIRCGQHGHYCAQCPTLPRGFSAETHCAVCQQRTSVVAHYSHQCSRRVRPPVDGYESYHSCGVATKYFTGGVRKDAAAESDAHGDEEAEEMGNRRGFGGRGGRGGHRRNLRHATRSGGWADEHDRDLHRHNRRQPLEGRGRGGRSGGGGSGAQRGGRPSLFTEI